MGSTVFIFGVVNMQPRQEDLRQSHCTTFIIDAVKYPLHDVGCVFVCVCVYF